MKLFKSLASVAAIVLPLSGATAQEAAKFDNAGQGRHDADLAAGGRYISDVDLGGASASGHSSTGMQAGGGNGNPSSSSGHNGNASSSSSAGRQRAADPAVAFTTGSLDGCRPSTTASAASSASVTAFSVSACPRYVFEGVERGAAEFSISAPHSAGWDTIACEDIDARARGILSRGVSAASPNEFKRAIAVCRSPEP